MSLLNFLYFNLIFVYAVQEYRGIHIGVKIIAVI